MTGDDLAALVRGSASPLRGRAAPPAVAGTEGLIQSMLIAIIINNSAVLALTSPGSS